MKNAWVEHTLSLHQLWLQDKEGGVRADLSEEDLCRTDLSRADLRRADLSRADLIWANLSDSNLRGADLSKANLIWANLSRAILSGANLSGAKLSGGYIHCPDILSVITGKYSMHLYRDCNGVFITSGCRRSMKIADAIAHWTTDIDRWTVKTTEYGAMQVKSINFLVEQAQSLGWEI